MTNLHKPWSPLQQGLTMKYETYDILHNNFAYLTAKKVTYLFSKCLQNSSFKNPT